jgi:glutamate/tyrosine decarboxylase-like PLP-dependent enzyme
VPSGLDLQAVAHLAEKYLRDIGDRSVAPKPDAIAEVRALAGALPEHGMDANEVVKILNDVAGPATVASAGGRYFGFVTGGSLPAALGAAWLVSAWDQNAGLRVSSPGAAVLEDIALRWVVEALGLPASTGGALVTGATMANFTCLAAARHAILARVGWDVESRGLFGAPEIKVVVGDEVHSTLLKALAMLGLGRDRVIRVPADSQGRMRADVLPPLDDRTILCIQAGNVNTGAFDPAHLICPVAREAGAWIHVDGAFGIWAAASRKYRYLTAGYDLADSWATDAHKWPNTGYDCGVALVREPSHLTSAMAISAAYLNAQAEREPMHYGPEASRRARGVELWAALRSLGREGLEQLIDRTCRHARRFAEGLSAAGFTILNEVRLNQVLVAMDGEQLARIQREGTCWCGSSVWQGHKAMRISVSSWATSDEDVERSLAAMIASAHV